MGDIYHAGKVYAGSVPIDDTQASEETVYSSAKTEELIDTLNQEYVIKEFITPSDHYHYIDIDRTQGGKYRNYIIASINQNQTACICALQYSSTSFRVLVRNPDGSAYANPMKITVLMK